MLVMMSEILDSPIALAIGLCLVGVLATWLFAHLYYRKALSKQRLQNEKTVAEQKATYEAIIAELKSAKEQNASDARASRMMEHLANCKEAWAQQGTAEHYLRAVDDLTDEERADLYQKSRVLWKGRPPKKNPFAG